jgi:colanic acid/amylovoran biosynthesis protein
MNSPRLALDGIGGVYNYGCEAIVRGTVAILRRAWPDADVRYYSRQPRQDARALRDAPVTVKANPGIGDRLLSQVRGLLWRHAAPGHWSTLSYKWVKGADCVLSIGGDMLTLGLRQRTATTFHQTILLERILDYGKPVVLWGASVGPFEANPHAAPAFSQVLRRLSLITCREPWTQRYLESLGIRDNVRLAADPAFVLEPAPPDAVTERWSPPPGATTIGVNLSPLSAAFAATEDGAGNLAGRHAEIISRLVRDLDADVLLIPHVVCPWNPADDDAGYLEHVRNLVGEDVRARVTMLPPGLGARRTKRIVSRCGALLAARMHCAISGISCAVPTILLSYSPKSVGMGEYVYGHSDAVLPVDADYETVSSAARRLLADGAQIRSYLSERMQAICRDSFCAGELVREVLESRGAGSRRE